MAQLEVKKMKQGMSYSCKEKTIILNVFKYFRQQFPDKCITDLVRRTAKATGCSEKSIFQFRKEEASAEGFKEPSKTKIRKNININSRDIKYDNNVRQSIRDIIYELKYRNVVPSLNTILKHVNLDTHLPNFSVMTLRRLLFDMGFCYEKNGNKSILVEKDQKNVNAKVSNQKQGNRKVVNLCSNNSDTNSNNGQLNSVNNISSNKPIIQVPPGNVSVTSSHMQQINGYHGHRIMHVPVPQSDPHMMARMQPPPSMPMVINHRNEFIPSQHPHAPSLMQIRSSNIDIPAKPDNHLWMQQVPPPPLAMVKQ